MKMNEFFNALIRMLHPSRTSSKDNDVCSLDASKIITSAIGKLRMSESKAYSTSFSRVELKHMLLCDDKDLQDEIDSVVKELSDYKIDLDDSTTVSLLKDIHYSNDTLYITFDDSIGRFIDALPKAVSATTIAAVENERKAQDADK